MKITRFWDLFYYLESITRCSSIFRHSCESRNPDAFSASRG